MMKLIKPMLSYTVKDVSKLLYPLLASRKLDGIRCTVQNGQLLSRTLKPIPNKHCQDLFGRSEFEGFDGELIVGEPNDKDVYRNTNSGVMSVEGEPDVYFYVFDTLPKEEGEDFSTRYFRILDKVSDDNRIRAVNQHIVCDENQLKQLEEKFLAEGYEGLMVRKSETAYKEGRSTPKVGELGKLKRFSDSEARIIGYECMYTNRNEAVVNELGYTERSSHKENMIPTDMLGKLICEDLVTGIEFSIGSGLTHEQRKNLWEKKDDLIGRLVKYKHFEVGVKEAPRFPTFIGFRDLIDLED